MAYARDKTEETYHCRFGVNPSFEVALTSNQLQIGARDEQQEIRAVELNGEHPFFVATLFQHERVAFRGEIPPLVLAFIHAINIA